MKKALRKPFKKTNAVGQFIKAVKDGSTPTRLSCFVMGFGQIARGQLGKGLLYLVTQAAFWLYLIFFGGRYILHLFSGNLGTQLAGERWNEELQMFEKIKGDNSFLILLYGVVGLVLLAIFTVIWFMNVRGSYANDVRIREGRELPTLKEDLRVLINEKFYIPLLGLPFLGLLI